MRLESAVKQTCIRLIRAKAGENVKYYRILYVLSGLFNSREGNFAFFAHLFSDKFVVLIPVTIGNQSVSLARELLIDCSVSNSLI